MFFTDKPFWLLREAVEGTTICTPSRSELSQNFPYRYELEGTQSRMFGV